MVSPLLAVAGSPELENASVLTLCWFLTLQENTKSEEALLFSSYLMYPFSLKSGTVVRSLSKSCSLHTAADSLKRM